MIVALLICAAVAAPAQANFKVGMSDQDPAMFDNAKFQSLDIERVRYLVAWDWYKHDWQRGEVAAFMNRAEQDGAEVLVHFTAARGCYVDGRYKKKRSCKAPKVKKYKQAVKRFLREYPSVDTFGVWNEANHVSQPTVRKPRLAAKYFLAARKVCGGCDIVAADVLDSKAMPSWLTKFKRHAKGKARIWGLHNYTGVNRKRSDGTRTMLRNAPGEVWLTETGGLYKFLPDFKPNQSRQANRTKFMFKLADRYDRRLSGLRGRVTRLYNYQWTGVEPSARFDAGLVNEDGKPRKAYRKFRKLARKYDR